MKKLLLLFILSAFLFRLYAALHQDLLQLLGADTRLELVVVGHGDAPRLLADHHSQSVGLLGEPFGGAMAQTEVLGDIQIVGHGQDARSRHDAVGIDDDGAVVKGRVLEEDILQKTLRKDGIDALSGADEVAQRQVVLHHDEGPHPVLGHIETSQHDGRHLGARMAKLFTGIARNLLLGAEEVDETVGTLVSAQTEKEVTNLLLEEHDDSDGAHADHLIEDAAQKLHLDHLGDDDPEADEEQQALEDVDGARLLHELVAREENHGHKEDVENIFYANFEHNMTH